MTKRDSSQKKEVHCANCFACFAETELCPMEPGYDEDKVMARLQKIVEERGRIKANVKSDDK